MNYQLVKGKPGGVCFIKVQQGLKRKSSGGVLRSRVMALSHRPLCTHTQGLGRKDRKGTQVKNQGIVHQRRERQTKQ